MSSEQIRETLKKNVDSIFAVKLQALEEVDRHRMIREIGQFCVYTYADGSHCAVGACLNDEQLKAVSDYCLNEEGVDSIIAENILSVDDATQKALYNLQVLHDAACQFNSKQRQFDNFNKALAEFIEHGTVTVDKSQELWHSGSNSRFIKSDDGWKFMG